MRDTDYAYCVARVRAAESKMLTADDLKKLREFSRLSDAIRFLKEKSWTSSDGETVREIISFEKNNLWKLLSESVPDKAELSVLCALNDFFNIKAVVKCLLCGISPEGYIMVPTTVNVDSIKENLYKRDFSAIFKDKSDAAEKAYFSAVESESGQLAEVIVDRAAIDYMARYSAELNDSVIAKVCGFISDSSNIKIALRCVFSGKDESFINEAIGQCINLDREKLVDSAVKGADELYSYLDSTVYKSGVSLSRNNFSDFEIWCEERLIEIASESRYTAFSFSPVCFYYYKKLNEIKKVSSVLAEINSREIAEGQGDADA